MKRIATVLAPLALVFAAAGAQASELSHGDFATQPVRAASSAFAPQPVAGVPAGPIGEVSFGDIGLGLPSASPSSASAAPATVKATQRVVSNFAIGA